MSHGRSGRCHDSRPEFKVRGSVYSKLKSKYEAARAISAFRISSFGFISGFGIRISAFLSVPLQLLPRVTLDIAQRRIQQPTLFFNRLSLKGAHVTKGRDDRQHRENEASQPVQEKSPGWQAVLDHSLARDQHRQRH